MGKQSFKLYKIAAVLLILAACVRAEKHSAVLASPVPVDRSIPVLSGTSAPDGSLMRVEWSPTDQKFKPCNFFGEFDGVEFPFFPSKKEGVCEALFAVPFNSPPSKKSVIVKVDPRVEVSLEVVDGQYASEVLKVSNRHVNPNKKDLRRIQKESAEIGAIYKNVTREKLWTGPFVLPVESAFTSPFGTKRVFNGQMKSFHQGVDLKAAVGTPVNAPAGGIVVLAKDLFFTGGTVILDHGYGIFTIYAHLSRIKVKVGHRVKTGDALGLAGMSGRASGPHLHWGAVAHRLKFNPQDLMRVMQ